MKTLLGKDVLIQSEVCDGSGETVSSTRIRRLLSNGAVEEAAVLLTRPFSFQAPVVHGKSLGHKIGFPTLNQYFPREILIPKHGVYITDCDVDGHLVRGISNVGVHPTVDRSAAVNCETHLPDFHADLYGTSVTVHFLKFLREEQRFDSIEALTDQIRKDVEAAKHYRKP